MCINVPGALEVSDRQPRHIYSTDPHHFPPSSFYTREDFVDIANAGLNTVRIPIGYWAVDLLDYEPYVSGQYPYLIQAVQWAKELNLSVMISLHGAPGSQNGAETSGLIGPVLFATNQSNIDRTFNVLKNFTTEFSRDVYGGAVTSIELLNEPGLFTLDFSMAQLQDFYTKGVTLIHGINSTMNVIIADAFYGAAWWANYNPVPDTPLVYTILDAHQFYAFPPLNALDEDGAITRICAQSALLKQNISDSGIPPTIIGEWSLQSGVSTSTNNSEGLTQERRTWFRLFFEAQIAAYTSNGPGQSAGGWIFWAWKTEGDIATWSYRRGITSKWIPADVSDPNQLAYPILASGCVDSNHSYSAPAYVPPFNPDVWSHASTNSAGDTAGTTTASGTSGPKKSGGSSSTDAKGAASSTRSPLDMVRAGVFDQHQGRSSVIMHLQRNFHDRTKASSGLLLVSMSSSVDTARPTDSLGRPRVVHVEFSLRLSRGHGSVCKVSSHLAKTLRLCSACTIKLCISSAWESPTSRCMFVLCSYLAATLWWGFIYIPSSRSRIRTCL
nr:putative glucan 1,3-beta-glucosidase a [Quercus suber]